MKKAKNVLLIVIATLIVFSITGCDNQNQNDNNKTNTTNTNVNSNINKSNDKNKENAVYDEEGNLIGYKKMAEEYPKTEISGTIEKDGLLYSDMYIEKRSANQCYLIMSVKNNTEDNIIKQLILVTLHSDKWEKDETVGGQIDFVAADSVAKVEVPIALDVLEVNKIDIEFYKG